MIAKRIDLIDLPAQRVEKRFFGQNGPIEPLVHVQPDSAKRIAEKTIAKPSGILLQRLRIDRRQKHFAGVRRLRTKERIPEIVDVLQNVMPEGIGFLFHSERPKSSLERSSCPAKKNVQKIRAFFGTIADEVAELTRMRMVVQSDEKTFVEFEGSWIKFGQLPNDFDELKKHRRLFFRVSRSQMSAAIGEFMSEFQPFLLD